MDSTEDLIETQENEEEEKNEKLLKLPLARIKHIVKMDPDVQNVSQEAVFLIGKATELFVESLTVQSYTQVNGKRKTLQKKDLDSIIEQTDALAFLEGVFDN